MHKQQEKKIYGFHNNFPFENNLIDTKSTNWNENVYMKIIKPDGKLCYFTEQNTKIKNSLQR
jgi:hypothetical protein